MMNSIPKDPYMLLSFINMHLRDEGISLQQLCSRLDIDVSELESRLAKVGFSYLPDVNQFR